MNSQPLDSGLVVLDVAAASHPGKVKDINQDHYLVIRFGRTLENLLTNLDRGALEEDHEVTGYVMLVADGIGGTEGGEVASQLAVKKLVDLLVETPDWIMSLKREQDLRTVLERLDQRFWKIDEALKEDARLNSSRHGIGTTLTIAGLMGNDLILGHIGDSRAYLLRNGILNQLTTDHTLVQALVDAGIVAADDVAAQASDHVLTAALGSLDDVVRPQVKLLQLTQDDQILLCTDGLTQIVDDQTIQATLFHADSAHQACHELVDLALAGGGSDNITVVLARIASHETTD
ncbi:MAG TPA: PP2C family serine/threonine-protein phosphatase [Pyrinomonadaceae bacterium]|nr:PP2C family serine/threonine-protein phosphatase [Pyrinomonadaceae bacterium]